MIRRLFIYLLLWLPLPAGARLAEPLHPEHKAQMSVDLAQIRQRGELRVLINQSRHSSAEVKGQALGLELQRLRSFVQFLNRDSQQALRLRLIPKAKEQLVAALQRGEGDLLAPGELLDINNGQLLSASRATVAQVAMVLVTRQGTRRYQRLEQLAGRNLSLPRGSAAAEAVRQLNQQLGQRKLAPLLIEWVDSSLAVEDVLEMVQAGIYPFSVVEQPIAERWAKVMPRLRVERHLQIGARRDMHWWVRRDAPMLLAKTDAFLRGYVAPGDQDAAFVRLNRRAYRVHYPLARADRQRLEKLRAVLQRHAGPSDLDWLSLAALAFKESSLNPAARGANGATGLMQITRSAAQGVGVSNISHLQGNVQAASRYLAMLRRRFFASRQIAEPERLAFALAAYNMGPQRVQSLRAEARRRGLNANQWFFQVERVAMEQLGLAAVSHVSSVNKYRLALVRERYSLETPRSAGQ